ncbi:deoxyribodipyrimidine photo-lyase [Massilia sp. W12]|uniref:cryptochrome/photolyase family protein n=1 Tax=Massilia sp. W12 TaxID=3126507 RepID=UPI0030D09033
MYDSALFWFRRDLRLHDNTALLAACRMARRVYCVFVFDATILQTLPRIDRRVEFIHACCGELAQEVRALGGQLLFRHGDPQQEIPALAHTLGVQAVFANHDIEPAAMARDAAVAKQIQAAGRVWHSCKDQVIFEKEEILTQAGRPYTVFTPYKNAWLKAFAQQGADAQWGPDLQLPPPDRLQAHDASALPPLEALGFARSNLSSLELPPGASGAQRLLQAFLPRLGQYKAARDFPARKGPSYLSMHLRFGALSIRQLVRAAWQAQQDPAQAEGAACWLSELIWREFYQMILYCFPHVLTRSFKPAFDAIQWERGAQADDWFAAWYEGRTGYPLVDAAMQQLNQSGYMHNRLRMVTASFLCKDLGLDWRWGEAYFAEKLNDFELASNNGGWQWAASSGCDAQPWFRIFNPWTQSEKFDAEARFIARYLPQLAALPPALRHAPQRAGALALQAAGLHLGQDYPYPLVEHEQARERTLQRYAVVKGLPGTD